MALTELQKERIAFHLDYANSRYLLQISQRINVFTLNASQELALIGQPVGDLALEDIFVFEDVSLCSKTSILGRVEQAFFNLGPSTIEDSLYVAQAGSVTLRGNELSNREKLYCYQVQSLGQLVGSSQRNRVGW